MHRHSQHLEKLPHERWEKLIRVASVLARPMPRGEVRRVGSWSLVLPPPRHQHHTIQGIVAGRLRQAPSIPATRLLKFCLKIHKGRNIVDNGSWVRANGTYLTRATPNDVHLATEAPGKTRNIRSFFPCLPCDSVAIFHAWALSYMPFRLGHPYTARCGYPLRNWPVSTASLTRGDHHELDH